jgi:hypothetical protein
MSVVGGSIRSLCFGLAILAPALEGCSSVTSCDASMVPAIRLAVIDEKTGATLIGESTIVWAGPNVVRDSVRVVLASGAGPVSVGFQAGAYSLMVIHAGYADWHGSIMVSGDRCKPQTASIAANMTAK